MATRRITDGKFPPSFNIVDPTPLAKPDGRKYDNGKLQFGLLPPLALMEVVKVMTFGAQKYAPDNWQLVDDAQRRYFDAAERHIWQFKLGELTDDESGLPHLAHAICCLMFLYEHSVKYSVDPKTPPLK